MKFLINWPPLRQPINYIRERFTFLVLLCWPAIIWLVCRALVWLTDGLMVLLGKPTEHLYRLSSATYDAKRATENFRQLGAAAVYPVQHGDGVHLGSAALYESK